MSKLHEAFKTFETWVEANGAINEEELNPEFKKLAEELIFGGHIVVDKRFHIYIRTVEFYFHQENEGIKDPIVYHRNGKVPGFPQEIEVPYFPMMAVHGHPSGYDITFESGEQKYRASALIRKYSVFDSQKKVFIAKDDERSTFLYYYLNGFSIIEDGKNNNFWKEKSAPGPHELNNPKPRRNVKKYIGEVRQKENDLRPWSYSAKGELGTIE